MNQQETEMLGCCCHLLVTTGTWLRSRLKAVPSPRCGPGAPLASASAVRWLHNCHRNSMQWECGDEDTR